MIYKKELKRSFAHFNKFKGLNLNIISVYIILRRTNIYVTIVKDGKLKVFPLEFNDKIKNYI